jgi:hypothetical protein
MNNNNMNKSLLLSAFVSSSSLSSSSLSSSGILGAAPAAVVDQLIDEVCAQTPPQDRQEDTPVTQGSPNSHNNSNIGEFVSNLSAELVEYWRYAVNRDVLEFLAFGTSSIYLRLSTYTAPRVEELSVSEVEVLVFLLKKLVAVLKTMVITFAW